MVFGLRSKSKKEDRYASSLNLANETNKGLARYKTDHRPASTRLAGDKKSSSRHNQGLERYETDHPPQETQVMNRKQSGRDSTLALKQTHISRKTSTRPSLRMVAQTSFDPTRATSKHGGREIVTISRSSTSRQTDRYRATTFTVHQEVTVSADPRSMHPKAEHITQEFKKMLGYGSSDPRSLDKIMDRAYYNGHRMSDFVRDKLDVSSRDQRPLEEILDAMERKADQKGPEYTVLATWDRNSQADAEEYYISVDDPQDPRGVIIRCKVLLALLV